MPSYIEKCHMVTAFQWILEVVILFSGTETVKANDYEKLYLFIHTYDIFIW